MDDANTAITDMENLKAAESGEQLFYHYKITEK